MFDCVPIDLTWDCSYHTSTRFEDKAADALHFGNVPLVNLYPQVMWFDCDIISSMPVCTIYVAQPVTVIRDILVTKTKIKMKMIIFRITKIKTITIPMAKTKMI
jgi:hypothetical protein